MVIALKMFMASPMLVFLPVHGGLQVGKMFMVWLTMRNLMAMVVVKPKISIMAALLITPS